MIRRQGGVDFLFDLGSFNGSYLNGVRVTAGCELKNGDQINFADHEFLYSAPQMRSSTAAALGSTPTIAIRRQKTMIILVSDIKGFTALSEAVESSDLAQIIGGWYAECEQIMASAGATVDKFIGDCVLAYWSSVTEKSLRSALLAAEQLLASCDTITARHADLFERLGRSFQLGVAIHTGPVTQGAMSPGESTLLGDAVNLTFRLESLTRQIGADVVVSGEIVGALPELRHYCAHHGHHHVKGRAATVELYSVTKFPPRE